MMHVVSGLFLIFGALFHLQVGSSPLGWGIAVAACSIHVGVHLEYAVDQAWFQAEALGRRAAATAGRWKAAFEKGLAWERLPHTEER